MFNYFLVGIFSLFSVLTFAETKAHFAFTGQQVMITMVSHNIVGQFDNGPETLFRDLNLPIQKSFIGDGKVLADSQSQMTLVVADRGNHRYEASIVIKSGPDTKIDLINKYTEARFDGVMAQILYKAFQLSGGRYEFINQDATLKIIAEPESFLISYH
jgi:hypothetical protein